MSDLEKVLAQHTKKLKRVAVIEGAPKPTVADLDRGYEHVHVLGERDGKLYDGSDTVATNGEYPNVYQLQDNSDIGAALVESKSALPDEVPREFKWLRALPKYRQDNLDEIVAGPFGGVHLSLDTDYESAISELDEQLASYDGNTALRPLARR